MSAQLAWLDRGTRSSLPTNRRQKSELLFAQFPVLRRLATVILSDWTDFVREFVDRLAVDRQALDEFFGDGATLGVVVALSAGLSDPHEGGRRVLRLTFANSAKQVLYKPKDFTAEQGLATVIAFLQGSGLPDLPSLPRALARRDYGWVESVCPTACVSKLAVEAYYRKAGMLVGLAFFLHGTDCTMDNLIATGSGPLLIDTETFFQPAVRPFGPDIVPRSDLAADFSVLETGLLPFPHLSITGPRCDICGLAGAVDGIAPEGAMPNQPTLNGQAQFPKDYEGEIIEGFQAIARTILEHRAALLRLVNSRSFTESLRTRLIFRNSDAYKKFLQDLCQAKLCGSEEEWIGAFKELSRPFVDRSVPAARFWPLVSAECAALDRLDLPRIYSKVNSEDLEIGGETIQEFFRGSPINGVCRTIADFAATDLQFQVELIRNSLRPPAIGLGLWAPMADTGPPWLDMAMEIAESIHRQAKYEEPGAVWWPRPAFERPEPAPTRMQRVDLYEGALGIALFLSAAQRAVGTQTFGNAIRRSARAVKEALIAIVTDAGPIALGAGGGLGSLVLGGLFISRLTGYPEFSELAALAADEITSARIVACKSLDAFRGVAGAALALLAFHQATGDESALHRATQCGRQLVDHCAPGGAWESDEESGMLGLAHGAAGISLALVRLFRITKDDAFLKVAELALNFQRSARTPAQPLSPLRRGHSGAEINGWCHGGLGIALARLASIEVFFDRRSVREEVHAALDSSARGSVRYDHLCCGRSGHIEVLLTAADSLQDPRLAARAHEHAHRLLARAVSNGHYTLKPYFAQNLCVLPGLFRGLSGIGYSFLRLAGQRMPFSLLSFCLE